MHFVRNFPKQDGGKCDVNSTKMNARNLYMGIALAEKSTITLFGAL